MSQDTPQVNVTCYYKNNPKIKSVLSRNLKQINKFRQEIENENPDNFIRAEIIGDKGRAEVTTSDELRAELYKYYA